MVSSTYWAPQMMATTKLIIAEKNVRLFVNHNRQTQRSPRPVNPPSKATANFEYITCIICRRACVPSAFCAEYLARSRSNEMSTCFSGATV